MSFGIIMMGRLDVECLLIGLPRAHGGSLTPLNEVAAGCRRDSAEPGAWAASVAASSVRLRIHAGESLNRHEDTGCASVGSCGSNEGEVDFMPQDTEIPLPRRGSEHPGPSGAQ